MPASAFVAQRLSHSVKLLAPYPVDPISRVEKSGLRGGRVELYRVVPL